MNEYRKRIRKRMESTLHKLVRHIFKEKCEKLGVEADLDFELLTRRPVVGENVYGEAFPKEKRVKLEVYPEASKKEIEKAVCDELIHIKWPGLKQYDERGHEREEYREKIEECIGD